MTQSSPPGRRRRSRPQVMGVLNVTPDSFSDGGLFLNPDSALRHTERLLEEGAGVIDVGGASSRPGADVIPIDVELSRITPVVDAIVRRFPRAFISIDTRHAKVASEMLQRGARMINDISGGADAEMLPTVARARAAYVIMHMQGEPKTMQVNPTYSDVVEEVRTYLAAQVSKAYEAGVEAVWCDPGFGFGKTIHQNYQLLTNLSCFTTLKARLLVGVSRKSMFWRPLKTDANRVIPATSAAHLWALAAGADMLRVHDVAAAVQVIEVGAALNFYSAS